MTSFAADMAALTAAVADGAPAPLAIRRTHDGLSVQVDHADLDDWADLLADADFDIEPTTTRVRGTLNGQRILLIAWWTGDLAPAGELL